MLPDQICFNPEDPECKSPYGAVPAGSSVTLALRPLRREGFCRALLRLRLEFADNAVSEIPMPWESTDYVRDRFSCRFSLGDYVGLVWYSFRLEDSLGRAAESEEYQLTVYDNTEHVPDWFGRGVTYQIFPDRFSRTRIPSPDGLPGGRTVHAGWEEEPEYLPDAAGKIRNRDFFGGDLNGITEKLPYLAGLGVETVYLCPVFEAAENHRYCTADYEKIDPMLGSEEDFRALCRRAHELGMHVLLDGVFNHTGRISRYFNADGFYPETGAAQSESSPYAGWYRFRHWPDDYESWWGIQTLPAVEENDPGYRDYIFHTVVPKWLRAGADGWRLDVADELPDDFVAGVHASARAVSPETFVLGEVWEDGTTKIAYDVRRRHLLGRHCDGLMNYPFRTAALAYLQGGDAAAFRDEMETLREHYPPFAFYNAMNSLGTHDTPRILTLLGMGGECRDRTRTWRAKSRLTKTQYAAACRKLMAGAVLLYAFPGSPTVYYGDEAGMQGFEDPFNRRTYPWGREDRALQEHFRKLGQLRRTCPALREGSIRWVAADGPLLAFVRETAEESILCAVNASDAVCRLPVSPDMENLLGNARICGGMLMLEGPSGYLLRRKRT